MIRRNYTLSCQNSTLSIFLFQNFFSISTENEITQRIKIKYYVSKTAYKTYDISTISSYIFSYQNFKSFYFKMKLFKGSTFSIKNPLFHVSKKTTYRTYNVSTIPPYIFSYQNSTLLKIKILNLSIPKWNHPEDIKNPLFHYFPKLNITFPRHL